MKHYEIIEVISESNKNKVSLAAVEGIDCPVIVKEMTNTDSLKIYQQIRELNNIHFPKVYDCFQKDERLVVIEEYIAGENIKERCEKQPLTAEEIENVFLQLCEAVEALHHCNPPIIHRDIKPSNLLLSDTGVLKLIDFDASREYDRKRTTDDTIKMGTVEYAPPEQFGYSQTDERSDIYAIGAVLYELAYGQQYMKKVVVESAPGMDEAFSSKIKEVVNQCTMFDPQFRYQNIGELKKAFCSRGVKENRSNRKKWIIGVGVTAIAVIIALVIGFSKAKSETTNNGEKEIGSSDSELEAAGGEKPENTRIPELTPEPTDTPIPSPTEVPTPTDTPAPTPTDISVPTEEPTQNTEQYTTNRSLRVVGMKYKVTQENEHAPDYVYNILSVDMAPDDFFREECDISEFYIKGGQTQEALFLTTYFQDFNLINVTLTSLSDTKYTLYPDIPYEIDGVAVAIPGEALEQLPDGAYLVEFVLADGSGNAVMIYRDSLIVAEEIPDYYEPRFIMMSGAYEYPKPDGVPYQWQLRNTNGREIVDVYFDNEPIGYDAYFTMRDGCVLEVDRDLIDLYMADREEMKVVVELEQDAVRYSTLYR